MKTLYESILDIDNIETDTNTVKYLSRTEFKSLYRYISKAFKIDENTPVCITDNDDESMQYLCNSFMAEDIDISGLYPKSKIATLNNFAVKCERLINFRGPNPHKNYSKVKDLKFFFDSTPRLKTFDLKGIAESAKKIRSISRMFNLSTTIENIDLSYFDFSNLIATNNAFIDCISLKRIDLGNSKTIIKNASYMCQNDVKLEEFNAPNMILIGGQIFYNCESLKNINVRYVDVSNSCYNTFKRCTKLMNVNIFGLGNAAKHDDDFADLSWAISLSDKSWDFLFKNLGDGSNISIRLPDISDKKEKIIKKYGSIIKKYDIKLI